MQHTVNSLPVGDFGAKTAKPVISLADTLEGGAGRGIAIPRILYYLADLSVSRIQQPLSHRQPGGFGAPGYIGSVDINDATAD